MAEIAPDNKSSNSRATAAKMKVKQDKRSTTFQQAQAARNAAPTSDEPRRPSSNTTMAPDGSAKNAHGSSEAAPSTPCRDYSSSVSAETPKVQPTSAASPFRPILTSILIELAVWKSRFDEDEARADCRIAVPDPAKFLIMEYCGFTGFLKPAIEGA